MKNENEQKEDLSHLSWIFEVRLKNDPNKSYKFFDYLQLFY